MKLFVLISTIDEGIRRVPEVLLPEEDGVHYVVGWQRGDNVNENENENGNGNGSGNVNENVNGNGNENGNGGALGILRGRSDVTLTMMEGRGLCRNRNRVMEVAMGLLDDKLEEAVFIIADDDERIDAQAFANIRKLYSDYTKLDVALWEMTDITTGRLLKKYPKRLTLYQKRPCSYYPSSVEMTFRSRVYLMGLRFDERFGLGSEFLTAGEEEVFVTDAIRSGLFVCINPQVLCATSGNTTGRQLLDEKVLRSKGAVYGCQRSLASAFVRSWREALSLGVRNRRNPWFIFRQIWSGVKYIRS